MPRHVADSWEGPADPARTLPSRRRGLHWLLAISAIMLMPVPLYNRLEPRLFGLPFFYWYQLACAVVTIVTTSVVHLLTKGQRPQ